MEVLAAVLAFALTTAILVIGAFVQRHLRPPKDEAGQPEPSQRPETPAAPPELAQRLDALEAELRTVRGELERSAVEGERQRRRAERAEARLSERREG